MFVYSLDGLKIDGDAAGDVEIEENETTARAAVYQVLARLFAVPDADTHAAAVAGEWPERLRGAAGLLAYAFEFGGETPPSDLSADDLQAEFLRLFEVGPGTDGPPAPLIGGVYAGGDRMKALEEVVRFYEYFGLKASLEDPRPPDHLATELEFMQYLTFKEAASSSPRLQASFRRAQEDFLERQLAWLPGLLERVRAAEPLPFWAWVVETAHRFVEADREHVAALAA